jgi:hypothetical protein
LLHRPIRPGASWYDQDIIEASAQLTEYHAQACRRFPTYRGLNVMDEPGVNWRDPAMDKAFKEATGMDPPEKKEDFARDPKGYQAYQVFRNHVLQDFQLKMKPHLKRISPEKDFTLQTFGDIVTGEGLYPSSNEFMDVQVTHMYDHWPTTNNWISFDVNLRRANRKVFWNMPLTVFTGCYGIVEDQWRAAWALGMSEKLDGHGYFLGAGELDEQLPWAEYSLAEMVKINRLNEKFGDFFISLKKPVTPAALWYSLSQAAGSNAGRGYEQEIVGAYFALKRAHFPVTIVTDEDLRDGLLKEHKVLLVCGVDSVAEDLQKAVNDFAGGGGKVISDRATTVDFKGARKMEMDFRAFAASYMEVNRSWYQARYPVSMRLRRDLFGEEGNLRELNVLNAALAPLVEKPVDAQSPFTLLAVQEHGDARYVFVANDASVYAHPNEGLRWITMQESVPAEDVITMPFARGKAVYDLFTGERIALDDNGSVKLKLPMAALRVLAVYPKEITEPKLGAGKVGSPPVMEISAASEGNSGALPVEVILRDESGKILLDRFDALDMARADGNRWRYQPAANDASGKWTIELHNLLTARTTTLTVGIQVTAAEDTKVVRRIASAAIFDEKHYKELTGRKDLFIVPGSGEGCEAIARELQEKIGGELKKAADIRKEDVFSEQLDPRNPKNKGLFMMSRWAPLNLSTGANLILVGTPENNELIKDINNSGMLMRQIAAATVGRGQGLVEYVFSPFDTDKDAAIVAGYDAAGLRAAADRLLAAVGGAGKQPSADIPKDVMLAADLQVEDRAGEPRDAARKPVTPLPVIEPAWWVKLPDGVRKIAAAAGLLATADESGRVTLLDSAGKELWRRDLDYRAIAVAISPDGKFISAAAFPRTYVWNRAGILQYTTETPLPGLDDVEGLAMGTAEAGPRIVRGTWSGDVAAFDGDGKRLWFYPPPKPVKKAGSTQPTTQELDAWPAPFKPIREVALLKDGTTVAGAFNELIFFDAEGNPGKHIPFDRPRAIRALGDNLLVASFKKHIVAMDRDGKILWDKPMADLVMAADVSPNGQKIAVALFLGEVLVMDASGNITADVKLPFEAELTGAAWDEKGEAVYLSTWEGQVMKWVVGK